MRLPKQDIGTFKKQRKAKRHDTCIFYEDEGNPLNPLSKKCALCLTLFVGKPPYKKAFCYQVGEVGRLFRHAAAARLGSRKSSAPARTPTRHPRMAQHGTAFLLQRSSKRPLHITAPYALCSQLRCTFHCGKYRCCRSADPRSGIPGCQAHV